MVAVPTSEIESVPDISMLSIEEAIRIIQNG